MNGNKTGNTCLLNQRNIGAYDFNVKRSLTVYMGTVFNFSEVSICSSLLYCHFALASLACGTTNTSTILMYMILNGKGSPTGYCLGYSHAGRF